MPPHQLISLSTYGVSKQDIVQGATQHCMYLTLEETTPELVGKQIDESMKEGRKRMTA